MSLTLLRRHRNYLGATISQGMAGMMEMGLGLILPLMLILNLGNEPRAGRAGAHPHHRADGDHRPARRTLVRPVRWAPTPRDRLRLPGTRRALLAIGAGRNSYLWILPGLIIYGVGLAIVLTVNDPVTLDTIPEQDHGQASGVSATAEQGGGAIGIALLYAVFHFSYLNELTSQIEARQLPALDATTGALLRDSIEAAEQTGLNPSTFNSRVSEYLLAARDASDHGYTITFLATAALAAIGLLATAWLVRKPDQTLVETAEPSAG